MKRLIRVTVECVINGSTERDLAYMIDKLKSSERDEFPMLNGSSFGGSGAGSIRCLGVRSVRRASPGDGEGR